MRTKAGTLFLEDVPKFMKKYLIEGRSGVGKTTLLHRIAERLPHLRMGGFYTAEIRECESRVGFRINTFTGRSGVMAHVAHKAGPRAESTGSMAPFLKRSVSQN
jgi:nucleoside-triphosphatase THEP1